MADHKVTESSTLEVKQIVLPKQQLMERSRAFLNNVVSKLPDQNDKQNKSNEHNNESTVTGDLCDTKSLVVFTEPTTLSVKSANGKKSSETEIMESDNDTLDLEDEVMESENTKTEPENTKPEPENGETKQAAKKTRTAKNGSPTSAKAITGYSCSHCVKSYTNKKALNKHVRLHHKELGSPPKMMADTSPKKKTHKASGKMRHKCDECDKDFSRADHLRRHSYIHSGLRPHSCPVCDQQFARKDKLSKHVLSHPRDTVRAALAAAT